MNRIHLPLGDRKYDVLVERGIFAQATDILQGLSLTGKIGIFTSPTVKENYLGQLQEGLEKAGSKVFTYTLPSGEYTKTLQTAEKLYSQLIEWQFDRSSTLIALGGGLVGDITGFVAATFMRGIRYVQIPTTLLSQVDSAIGGKVGMNHSLGKNLIGTFYQPKVVIIDPDLLQTLPEREMISGFGEIIKLGLVHDSEFFRFLAAHRKDLLGRREKELMESVVTRSVEIKAQFITDDEYDSGPQRILNFGHTIGHAIEAVAGFEALRHGEAVIKGAQAAIEISERLKLLTSNIADRIHDVLHQVTIPRVNLDVEEVLRRMHVDKKVIDGNITLILLKNIGKPVIVHNGSGEVRVEDQLLREAVANVCQ